LHLGNCHDEGSNRSCVWMLHCVAIFVSSAM
jgi:hypothetical protein